MSPEDRQVLNAHKRLVDKAPHKGRAAEAMAKVREINFSEQAYRGYLIRTNALSNTMWVEKDGHLICHVPAAESWAWARKSIDELLD